MPSFNNPKVTNPINSDVSEIRELLKIVAKQDYTGATDLPEGAKCLAAVSGGVQLQKYANSSWSSIGKLMHDVDQLDGHHASTTAVKNTIPVYNAKAQLVGSITGNAATATKLAAKKTIDIGGIASADAVGFDGSGNITIPINSINVANDDDNALVGIVSKAHGGTGRNDGAATDVIVPSLAGNVKASDYGQIGYAKDITGVDIDTLVVPGTYISRGISVENHWPYTSNDMGVITVAHTGAHIQQTLHCGAETIWQRRSTDRGASWTALNPSGGVRGSSLTLFVSKSGNDKNTGTDNAHPVLTINRALQIADGWKPTQLNTTVKLCLGEGDWGDVTFSSLPYTINIYPYGGVAATSYSESLPKFGTLSFSGTVYATARGVVADILDVNAGAFVDISNSITRFGQLRSSYSATIEIYKSTLEVLNTGSSLDAIRTYRGGKIVVGADSTCKVVENISVATAFLCMTSCSEILNLESITFSAGSGIQVTGKKYAISSGSSVYYTTKSFLDKLPGTIAGVLSKGVVVNGVPYGGGAADKALMADLSWTPVLLQTGGELSGSIGIRKPNSANINLINNGFVLGEDPASSRYWNICFQDKNNKNLADVLCYHNTDASGGNTALEFRLLSNDGTAFSSSPALALVYSKSKNAAYATCPTPLDSAKGTEIVTAAWANKNISNKLANYLPRNGTYALNVPTSEFGVGTGTTWEDSATLTLYGNKRTDSVNGGFALRAATSKTNRHEFAGKVSGELTWEGRNIVRHINGVYADAGGGVDITQIKMAGAVRADSAAYADSAGSANSAGSASMSYICSGVAVWNRTSSAFLPNYGTWAWLSVGDTYGDEAGTSAGGTTIYYDNNREAYVSIIAIRIG